MELLERDLADWEPLELEWHQGFAFLEGELLGDAQVRDTYTLISPQGKAPKTVVEEAIAQQCWPTPLIPGQPVWRHRRQPHLLADARWVFYRLPHYDGRHGFQVLQALPFQFREPLHSLGNRYWRDRLTLYYFHHYTVHAVQGVRHAEFALLEQDLPEGAVASPLYSDGVNLFLHGSRVASAGDQVRATNSAGYRLVNGQVCCGFKPLHQKDGSLLPIANPEGFHRVNGRWFSDGQSIIVQAQQGSSASYEYFYSIDDVDLESFTVLNERYAKDARRAYYITGRTIRNVGEFRLVKEQYPQFDASGRLVASTESDDRYFAVDEQHVYAAGTRLRGAHGPSFRSLGFNHYCDQQRAYLGKQPLELEVESLVVAKLYRGEDEYAPVLVGDRHGPLNSGGVLNNAMFEQWAPYFAAHPERQDYWWHRMQAQREQPEAEEDPANLRDIGQGFSLGRSVYFQGNKIEGLDAASFRLFNEILCGDVNGLYRVDFYSKANMTAERFSAQPVECFRFLDEAYITDGKAVFKYWNHYHLPELLRKADLATFETFGHGWARDASAVYCYGEIKKHLNPATTRFLGSYAFSPELMSWAGKPLDVEFTMDEVSVPHPEFLQLGTRKLFCGRRPQSAKRIDLPTLEFLDGKFARDKRTFYRYERDLGLTETSEDEYRQALAKAGETLK